jgi:hypothetical protein
MRKTYAWALLIVLFGYGGTSCGGGDDLTPVDSCKQVWSILCDKFFNCLSADEKEAAKAVIGLNAADCKVKFQGSECNADKASCDSGETFHSENAQMCLSGLMTLSCNDVKADPIVTPAICDQVCTK